MDREVNTLTTKQFDEIVTCPICLDRFRVPKLLPCGHSFCVEPCMVGLVHEELGRRELKCPLCRKICPLPSDASNKLLAIQQLPNNFTAQMLLELNPQITVTTPSAPQLQLEECEAHAPSAPLEEYEYGPSPLHESYDEAIAIQGLVVGLPTDSTIPRRSNDNNGNENVTTAIVESASRISIAISVPEEGLNLDTTSHKPCQEMRTTGQHKNSTPSEHILPVTHSSSQSSLSDENLSETNRLGSQNISIDTLQYPSYSDILFNRPVRLSGHCCLTWAEHVQHINYVQNKNNLCLRDYVIQQRDLKRKRAIKNAMSCCRGCFDSFCRQFVFCCCQE